MRNRDILFLFITQKEEEDGEVSSIHTLSKEEKEHLDIIQTIIAVIKVGSIIQKYSSVWFIVLNISGLKTGTFFSEATVAVVNT